MTDLTEPPLVPGPLSPANAAWFRWANRKRWERAARAAACRRTTVTERFLVDTNAYDALVATEARWMHVVGLCLAGHVGLLMTDVQHEEIAAWLDSADPADPDYADVGELVLRTLALPVVHVFTYGYVPGVSRPNFTRYGDPALLARLRGPGVDPVPEWPDWPRTPRWADSRTKAFRRRHTADALLAATAWRECAVLVTDDKRRLTRVATAERVPVWDSARFTGHLDALSY
jgi:hypothetical protein